MAYILSNYGHRYVLHLSRSGALDEARGRDDVNILCRLFARGALPANPELQALEARGFVEPVGDDVDAGAIDLRYARNPREHMSRVVFEYTTVCNLDCMHCRNTALEARAEADPARLRRVVDAAL